MVLRDILPYLEMNAIAAATCVSILSRRQKRISPDFGQHFFDHIILAVLAMLVLETASWIMQVYPAYYPHQVIMALYFLVQMVAPLVIARYCMSLNRRDLKHRLRLYLPALFIVCIGILANLVHPFAYRITPEGRYERLDHYFLLTAWPLVYIVGAVYECICYYRRANDRDLANHLLTFCVIACTCALIGAAVFGISIWPMLAFNLVYLYLNVQRKRETELGDLAFRDSLTGLKNTAAYRRKLDEPDSSLRAGQNELGVVVMDVNNLKHMNDTYGHEAGNVLLRTASQFICDIFDHSPVYRIGGDEFVAILRGRDYADRERLLARFDQEMAGLTVTHDNVTIPVRIARGLAVWDPSADAYYADLFQRADQNMYANKQQSKLAVG